MKSHQTPSRAARKAAKCTSRRRHGDWMQKLEAGTRFRNEEKARVAARVSASQRGKGLKGLLISGLNKLSSRWGGRRSGSGYATTTSGAVVRRNPKPFKGKAERKVWLRARRAAREEAA